MKRECGIEAIIEEIVNTLLLYSQPERIILFGSRASDTWTERSDIDIAVIDPDVTDMQMRRIREAVDEIRTLHRIDIVWLNNVTEEFRTEVLSTGKIIYEGKEKASICA
ncbi:MAG: hypothetical protein OHK0032_16480 [Thermodesulfovibrionales bacterium]